MSHLCMCSRSLPEISAPMASGSSLRADPDILRASATRSHSLSSSMEKSRITCCRDVARSLAWSQSRLHRQSALSLSICRLEERERGREWEERGREREEMERVRDRE